MKELREKHVLVTGGTGGIGREIAIAFADAGCNVTATGVCDGEIEQFDRNGRNVDVRLLDVTNTQSIASIVESLSRLDVLINCAGIILRGDQEF
jgi:NAD(P)-dependent dehydrogenase (short-subunit alcohol dehydrogenase family)